MNGNIYNYNAESAVDAFRIVKFGSADDKRAVATAAADALAGITTDIASVSGSRVDVVEDGVHAVKLGGDVTRGDFLTAKTDGAGEAVSCTEGNYIAQAKQSGVSGDIIYVNICRGNIPAAV